jgi:hypothetical protein|tara:strand:- start:1396 stop:1611 length:216 start_codon:yes stop_codon:yes gene_type:complete
MTYELDQPVEASHDKDFNRSYPARFLAVATDSKHFVGDNKFVVVFENGGKVQSFEHIRPSQEMQQTIRSFK